MKRFNNLFDKICTVENGVLAVIQGTKNKRSDNVVKKLLYSDEKIKEHPELYHQIDPEKAKTYIEEILPSLKNKTWQHKKPKSIHKYCQNRTKKGGKWRDLFVFTLEDHIIAHMTMQITMPAFTRGMYAHCCGSVPKRGIKHITKYVPKWLQNDSESKYFVKLDIKHFFENINSEKLLNTLKSKIKDENVIWIFEQIINSAPIACPVGYYTSPFLANLYLQDLDWYIEQQLYKIRRNKRIKYIKHYLRYMDDILLIGSSKKDLEKSISLIKKYLKNNLNLEIKNNWEIKKVGIHEYNDKKEWVMRKGTYWCDIGGYKFCKDASIMRDGIFLAAKRLAKKMNKSNYSIHQCQSLNSRIGWSKHCDSYHFLS